MSFPIRSDLPKISYPTMIDGFFVPAYVILGLDVAGMAWISNLYDHDEAKAIREDRLLRWAHPAAHVLTSAIGIIIAMK